jgi:hypothetical protein
MNGRTADPSVRKMKTERRNKKMTIGPIHISFRSFRKIRNSFKMLILVIFSPLRFSFLSKHTTDDPLKESGLKR